MILPRKRHPKHSPKRDQGKPNQRSMELILKCRIICTDLPPTTWGGGTALRLGVQRQKEVEQRVLLPVEQAVFEIELRVKRDEQTGQPNFLGPYAHGTPTERFLYLNWEQLAGSIWTPIRRAKLPMPAADWSVIEQASSRPDPVTVEVSATDSRGGPICATIKPPLIKWSLI